MRPVNTNSQNANLTVNLTQLSRQTIRLGRDTKLTRYKKFCAEVQRVLTIINAMGNWQLEVAKMVLYMAFPVGMFHYFNQPEVYETWVTKTKREIYPMVNKEEDEALRRKIREIRERQDAKAFEVLESSLNK
ncbi:protein PET100 homolog, mitochondrial isoform X2 [Neodiprion virginianus]|uniref:protein PET100 homolog, mitochondrial isoform X2 n=2 Tax=Neodiprion virginianus TaxID=2961670 RepID=UPI001EE73CAA|nr:protein PET100 homolog, mitochondrial isoform X2 [Neodiprion virginianus]XP_046616069.1 protein PET100 homolog, mitochondrial isoform X2 [Neodiprion virginianus]